MAGLVAKVGTALQLTTTGLTTADISEPALLILQCLLATETRLLDQEWTSRTVLVVRMAIVRNLWMTTCFWSFTIVSTWRRLRTAR